MFNRSLLSESSMTKRICHSVFDSLIPQYKYEVAAINQTSSSHYRCTRRKSEMIKKPRQTMKRLVYTVALFTTVGLEFTLFKKLADIHNRWLGLSMMLLYTSLSLPGKIIFTRHVCGVIIVLISMPTASKIARVVLWRKPRLNHNWTFWRVNSRGPTGIKDWREEESISILSTTMTPNFEINMLTSITWKAGHTGA